MYQQGPLPVLVWIYGGSYNSGSAALDLYRPHHFVRRGIIHVAMQYRVGVHGLLFMGKDSSAPGNVGMLDQAWNKFLRGPFRDGDFQQQEHQQCWQQYTSP